MKYDILNEYKKYLQKSFSVATAQTYYNRIDKLLDTQLLIEDPARIDMSKVLQNLAAIKTKNEFSQSKSALLHFLEFSNITLSFEQEEQINSFESNTHKKYRKLNKKIFKNVYQKIKYLRNQKLKLCFETLLQTGLRVSELSQIRKNDCVITKKLILFHFTGKGGGAETATIMRTENKILYDNLKKLVENTSENDCVFYSSGYLQTKANELGFCCHDLRRICAKLEYQKTKSKEVVRKKMRHASIKTTNIYLNSKIIMGKGDSN